MSGTAVAGSLITSKDIKDGTIKTRDLSKGSITADGLAGDVRAELSKSGQVGPQKGPRVLPALRVSPESRVTRAMTE